LQEADYWCIVDVGAGGIRLRRIVIIDKSNFQLVADQLIEFLLRIVAELFNQLQQAGMIDNDRLDRQLGLEFDLIQCMQVGWIG